MKPSRNTNAAFTLVELMASIAILGVMSFLLFSAFDQTSKAWLQGESRVETYSSARAALDYMSRELAQAMVNSNNLQFFGLTNAVAFIAPSDDRSGDPIDLAEVVYRLTNTAPPYTLVRRSSVYSASGTGDCWDYGKNAACSGGGNDAWDFYDNPNPNSASWMETSDSNRTGALAENIVSLNFLYVSTSNFTYSYWDSTNTPAIWNKEFPNVMPNPATTLDINSDPNSYGLQYMTNHTPAGVYITIGAVDSRTAIKLASLGTTTGSAWNTITSQAEKFFTTFVEIPNQ